MSLEFGPWLLVSIEKSLVVMDFIMRAAVPGGLAFWQTGCVLLVSFRVDLGLLKTSLFRYCGASSGRGSVNLCLSFGCITEGPWAICGSAHTGLVFMGYGGWCTMAGAFPALVGSAKLILVFSCERGFVELC